MDMREKVIVALDSFKGCLASGEANRAAAEGLLAQNPEAEVIQVPVSDGGEGWLEAFRSTWGGETVRLTVRDPLMRPVTAAYLVKGDTAVIEIAQASGLTLLSAEERNPLAATSYGTGQLVVDAVSRGCQEIIVGLGGSATSDCGIGMLRAMPAVLPRSPPVTSATTARTRLGQGRQEGWVMPSCNTFMPTADLA